MFLYTKAIATIGLDSKEAPVGLRYDEIAEILKIMDSSSCEELIIETGDMKLVVRRSGAGGTAALPRASPIATELPASHAPPRPERAETRAPVPALKTAANQIAVVAPMVGTFYRAPSPDAAPFVESGSAVRKGDPLGLIEVMKLFTTITSEHDGRVVEIGAQNGELVEYGRTLFIIEPA